jgi:FkbM family methyltransferase
MATDLRYRAWVVKTLAARGELGLAVRIGVLEMLIAAGRAPGRAVRLPLGGAFAYLAAETLPVDLETFSLMCVRRAFGGDCRGRVVLDIGAHKGYYALWALGAGARAVVSYEPENQNFAFLEMARRRRPDDGRWTAHRLGVGRTPGRAPLYVSDESWSHSLYPDLASTSGPQVAPTQEIEIVTLSSVLAEIEDAHPGVPVVLKVNVEGAAADVVLGASVAELEAVTEAHIDHETGSHYNLAEVLEHLGAAGLTDLTRTNGHNYHLRRPAGRRSEQTASTVPGTM